MSSNTILKALNSRNYKQSDGLMCWPWRGKESSPSKWMRESLSLIVPIDDMDTTHSWPIPGKSLLSPKMKTRRKKRNRRKLRQTNILFSKFSELPPELRLKIWRLSEPEVPTTSRTIGFIADNKGYIRAFAKIPTLLHISHETREETRKDYQLSFPEVCGGRPVYINFKIDKLYMYTAETFHRFFLDAATYSVTWYIESKLLLDETRYLLINCSSPSLPDFRSEAGFKNLKYLIMPKEKEGNKSTFWFHNTRVWDEKRVEEVKRSFLPEKERSEKVVADFEIVLTREFPTFELYFKDMVTPLITLFSYLNADLDRHKNIIEPLLD
jgi:2EXR family